jgi:hypothetical protein
LSLVKKFATVASGTLMSRVLGFTREMMMAAALGTGPVADVFYAAFQFPNTFRRLFAEGAFNAAFVPLFSKEIEAHGIEGAKRFSEEVFGVLFSVLMVITIAMEFAMPLIVRYLIAPGYADDPEKYALTVSLATIMFPYLISMSLTAMMSGMLNSLRRYFAAAVAPVFLNVILVGVLAYGWYRGVEPIWIGYALSWGVLAAGIVQLAIVYIDVRNAGASIGFRRPRLTPQCEAPALAGAARGDHRRHHADQYADRHGDRLRPGRRCVVAQPCGPGLSTSPRRGRYRGCDRVAAGIGAGAEGRQSQGSRESAKPLGGVHAVPDLAGSGGDPRPGRADRARALRARRVCPKRLDSDCRHDPGDLCARLCRHSC